MTIIGKNCNNNNKLKYYENVSDNPDREAHILSIIIADIKDAEEVGTGKPLSEYTAEELEQRVHEVEIILNSDHVDSLMCRGEYEAARRLKQEITFAQELWNNNKLGR